MKKKWSGAFNYLCDNPLKASFLKEFNSSVYLETIKNDVCDFCSFSDFVERQSVKEELKDLDSKLLLNFFKATLFTGFTQVRQDQQKDRKSIEEGMFIMFWDGIKA